MNSNVYDSIVETFLGMDLYNLPMPALPPADLNIPVTHLSPRYLAPEQTVAGVISVFNKLDRPQVRSLGFFSNLADGLVDKVSNNNVYTNGYSFLFRVDRFGAGLTGTIANTAGNAAIVGTATLFTKECVPGQYLAWSDGVATRIGQILSITDDTNLTLTGVTQNLGMYTGNTVAATVRPIILVAANYFTIKVPTLNQLYTRDDIVTDVSKFRPINGLSTFAGATPVVGASTMAVTGNGTRYLRDVTVGQTVRYGTGANLRTLIVQAIASDVAMTLTVPASGTLEAAFTYPALAGTTLGWQDDGYGIRFQLISPLDFYTISIDPLYGDGTRRLAFHAVAEIEHTFVLSGVI